MFQNSFVSLLIKARKFKKKLRVISLPALLWEIYLYLVCLQFPIALLQICLRLVIYCKATILLKECYKEDNKDLIFWFFPTIVNPKPDENSTIKQTILKEVHNLILDPQIQYVGVSVACKEDLLKPDPKSKKMVFLNRQTLFLIVQKNQKEARNDKAQK